ncbi:hypothetical protein HPL003_26930 [Paenibacillus terrae HPL-003]|uniref:Uncharacterized protein n=1 Tax=Paenibacillus terrae (strain HPL-003) TaxID=985665 RepID=G7VRS9_PAETH|nr:hypothetical protein HPL003_26930 [Paenibacillus terrae HPL-003]
MNKTTEYPNQTDGVYEIKSAGSGTKTFVLWREVVMAYVSPAIMAGIGGLVTADKGLQLGALTTIGGTSAFLALMLGLWLRSRGGHKGWIIGAPHLVVVGLFALVGAIFGLFAAWGDIWFTRNYDSEQSLGLGRSCLDRFPVVWIHSKHDSDMAVASCRHNKFFI